MDSIKVTLAQIAQAVDELVDGQQFVTFARGSSNRHKASLWGETLILNRFRHSCVVNAASLTAPGVEFICQNWVAEIHSIRL
jgi:hypothetical protein